MTGRPNPVSVSTVEAAPKPIGTRFRVRSFRRFSVQCSVYYASESVQGTGTVWNLSLNGWRVDGSQPVKPGMVVKLSVILPGRHPTVFVERATVRWSRGNEFGIEVSAIHEDEQARLTHFVTALV